MEKIDEIVQPAADAFHFVNRRIKKKGIFLNLKIKFEGKFQKPTMLVLIFRSGGIIIC